MSPFDSPTNDFMFNIIPIFIFIVFAIVFARILLNALNGLGSWNRNNSQPKLTVSAKIVSKRENVSTHMNNNDNNFSHTYANTTYFVTFEVESGDRMEFRVAGNEYGLLAEQDNGNLTFQGTRYLGFKRII